MRASQRKWSGKKERHLHRKSEATATAAAMPHFCFAATPSKNYPLSRLLFEVCAMPPGGAEFRENIDDVMSTGDGDGRMRARGEGGRARARDGWSQRGRRPTLEPIHSCGCTSTACLNKFRIRASGVQENQEHSIISEGLRIPNPDFQPILSRAKFYSIVT